MLTLQSSFKITLLAVAVIGAVATAEAKDPEEVCVYTTGSGQIRQVASRADIPTSSRKSAQCFSREAQGGGLAKPQEIELRGNVRNELITSPLGRIRLRWPRKVEELFGRTPMRAITDAAQTVARTVSRAGFPTAVQRFETEWQIVFMDENLPDGQIPFQLVSNCHPGWMTPPANIYFVAQRVAAGCSGQKVTTSHADRQMTEVALHEFGHAVEHYWLEGRVAPDRLRAEGFATWFERYAAQNSSVANARGLRNYHFGVAKQAFGQPPRAFPFSGTAEDYYRASLYFEAIVAKRGINGLSNVYKTMRDQRLTLFPAIEKTLSWNEAKLHQEVGDLLKDF